MKKIQDKEITVAKKETSYSKLLIMSVNNTPQGGFTVEDMRARLRILDAIEKSQNGVIELEDADYKKALGCINTMRWGIIDPIIVQFVADFKE